MSIAVQHAVEEGPGEQEGADLVENAAPRDLSTVEHEAPAAREQTDRLTVTRLPAAAATVTRPQRGEHEERERRERRTETVEHEAHQVRLTCTEPQTNTSLFIYNNLGGFMTSKLGVSDRAVTKPVRNCVRNSSTMML